MPRVFCLNIWNTTWMINFTLNFWQTIYILAIYILTLSNFSYDYLVWKVFLSNDITRWITQVKNFCLLKLEKIIYYWTDNILMDILYAVIYSMLISWIYSMSFLKTLRYLNYIYSLGLLEKKILINLLRFVHLAKAFVYIHFNCGRYIVVILISSYSMMTKWDFSYTKYCLF